MLAAIEVHGYRIATCRIADVSDILKESRTPCAAKWLGCTEFFVFVSLRDGQQTCNFFRGEWTATVTLDWI